ncbi:sensor domain-containing diguanylate cyclase [Sporosarcina sp. CAU 1771]
MRLSLKHLILFVAFLSVGLTLFSSITSGYRVSQDSLLESTLETNRVYAQKLAQTTDDYLNTTFQTLGYAAKDIGTYIEDSNSGVFLSKETERLFKETNTFNSVVVASSTGEVLAVSPKTLIEVGGKLNSPGAIQALAERKPLVSKPYISVTGRLIVFLSYPIFNEENNYQGYVGGTIYLLEQNVLNDLLGKHFYQDGSYVYVVDEDGRILYHPKINRIGSIVTDNPVIREIQSGVSGAKRLTNSQGIDMLAGYAYMPTTRWGVVSQRPTEAALLPSNSMRNTMMMRTLPFLALSFIIIIFLSNRIAYPLEKLGRYAESSKDGIRDESIEGINAWYFEAIHLQKALVKSFTFLEDKVNYFIHQSTTDPLTGLVNRRVMNEQFTKWMDEEIDYSIILIDIDKFKLVNDTYGHSVGDEVLKFLAKEMQEVSRENDVCCRYGGEEFILLLPETDSFEAFDVAERLRKKLETTISPTGAPITISSGIASFPTDAQNSKELIELADKCLYEAKSSGRNKTVKL